MQVRCRHHPALVAVGCWWDTPIHSMFGRFFTMCICIIPFIPRICEASATAARIMWYISIARLRSIFGDDFHVIVDNLAVHPAVTVVKFNDICQWRSNQRSFWGCKISSKQCISPNSQVPVLSHSMHPSSGTVSHSTRTPFRTTSVTPLAFR